MAIRITVSTKDQRETEDREKEILMHPAWHGDLSGIECEDTLRGLPPNSYLLREGEREFQYYFSFVIENPFTFKHQPFRIVIDHSRKGWGYRNGAHHWASKLDDLIPLILHCPGDACYPILRKDHAR